MELDAYREPLAPSRKRAAVGTMYRAERNILRERCKSELVAVGRLVQKAEAIVSLPSHRGKNGPLFTAEAPRSEEPPAAKRRKTTPPLVVEHIMTPAERKQVAGRLAELPAGDLPAHIVALLRKQSRGCSGGEIAVDFDAMEDEAVYELRAQLDKFRQERKNPSPDGCQEGEIVEIEQKEEDVDICGGVPTTFAMATSTLQLAEEEMDEDVDICGGNGMSTRVQTKDLGEISGNNSATDSDGSSSDSDSDSDSGDSSDSDSSDCDSDSDVDSSSSDESVSSPAPAAVPGTKALQSAKTEEFHDQSAAKPPATKMSELIDRARRRQEQEERFRARERSRRELVEMERTAAMASEAINPLDLKRLGIAQIGYMVCPPSLLRRLGLVLKADRQCQR